MIPLLPARIQAAITLAALLATNGFAATTNLTPVADTYLRNGGSADLNFGTAAALLLGASGTTPTVNHALLKFPIQSIPTNATITSVTLRLISVGGQRPELDHDLFRMRSDWSELGSTWNTRLAPSVPWGSPGAGAGQDYVASASATAPIDAAPTTNVLSSAGMVADVQLWLNQPGTNFGWIIIATGEEPGSGKRVGSRNDVANSPTLTVEYTVPSLPASPNLKVLALTNGLFRFSFSAETNRGYAIQFTDSLGGTNWNPLLNIGPPSPQEILVSDPLSTSNRFYRVRVN